jgi:hypothetical protein
MRIGVADLMGTDLYVVFISNEEKKVILLHVFLYCISHFLELDFSSLHIQRAILCMICSCSITRFLSGIRKQVILMMDLSAGIIM